MKRSSSLLGVLLAFLLFTSVAFAATRQQKITVSRAVMVGTVKLVPGDYNIAWTGDSGTVEVTFSLNKKVLATSSARIAAESNPLEQVETTSSNGATVLKIVKTKNATFYFDVAPAQ